MPVCTGRGDASGGHCCYLSGQVCEFLVDNETPGAGRFRCALMSELDDWSRVHADPRYVTIRAHFEGSGLCGTWQPKANQCCREAR